MTGPLSCGKGLNIWGLLPSFFMSDIHQIPIRAWTSG
jgi:hypothetical protein